MLAPTNRRNAWSRPRIAAIQDGSTAVVVFSPPDFPDYQTGMWYAYTPDGGSSWGGGRVTTTEPDDIPSEPSELTVDPSLGSFHLVYTTTQPCPAEICGRSVNYTSAPYATPWLWSTPVRISDALGYDWYATIAVDWASKQPGIGWRDFRRILFDRRDW